MKTIRCAVYTRKSTEDGLEKNLTRWKRNGNPEKTTLKARLIKAGKSSPPIMTMAVFPAAH